MSQERVLIIGGSSGMGLASASLLSSLGYHVTILSRSLEKLQKAQREIKGVDIATLDITKEDEVSSFFRTAHPFHHLVVTAADFISGPFLELSLDQARQFFDSKFWGQYHAAKYAAHKIIKGGSITLFSGVAGQKPILNLSVASSINGAIESLTRSLALELSPVRVNAISPGTINTPVWGGTLDAKQAGKHLPLQRVGEADDIAAAVRFLIECTYITGEILSIEGGAKLV